MLAATTTASLALSSFVASAPASAASADDGPIGGVLGGVGHVLGGGSSHSSSGGHTSSGSGSSGGSSHHSAPTAPLRHAPSASHVVGSARAPLHTVLPRTDRSSGPAASPNHASGSVVESRVGDKTPLVSVSKGSSQADRDHSRARAKLLAIGSYTLIGSQAASGNGAGSSDTGHGPVPTNPLCAFTGGRLCVDLLYADSASRTSHGTSQASTRTGVADVCVGGDDASGSQCDGVRAGVARSGSDVRTADGRTTSTASGSAADVCAGDGDSCAFGLDLLGSSSRSGSGAEPTKPTLASLILGNLAVEGPDDPAHVDVTKGCATEVLCATLNDKATHEGSDDSGSAADLTGLGDRSGADHLGAGIGNSDTGTSADQPAPTQPAPATGSGKQGGSAHGVLTDVGLGRGADRQDVVGLSDNRSSGDLDRTQGDASLLSVLGHDVIASHADSDGPTESHGPVPDNPLCASSGGALCIDPLYADSAASKTDTGSAASTRTGVAAICAGGRDATGATCDGVEVGVGQGASSLTNNGVTGVTRGSSSTSLANACVHRDDTCVASGDVLASKAEADSEGHKSQSSSILDLGLDGQGVGAPSDPIDLSVPAGCQPADSGSGVLCLFLNQVGADAAGGATAAGATVVDTGALGGTAGATGSQTGVTVQGGEPTGTQPPAVEPPGINPPGVDTPGTDAPVVAAPVRDGSTDTAADSSGLGTPRSATGVLPNTGGVALGVLGLGVLLVAAGAVVLAAYRRRLSA